MCELSAQRVLEEVTGLVGVPAGRVLLPRARLAVTALRQLQDGFFAPSRLQDSGLLVPRRDGTEHCRASRKPLPPTCGFSATAGTRSEAARSQPTGSC